MPIKGKYISREQFDRNIEQFAEGLADYIIKNPEPVKEIMDHIATNFHAENKEIDENSVIQPENPKLL